MSILDLFRGHALRRDLAWLGCDHEVDPRIDEYHARWKAAQITVDGLRREKARLTETLRRTVDELGDANVRVTNAEAELQTVLAIKAVPSRAEAVSAHRWDSLVHLVATASDLRQLRADAKKIGAAL